jgi:riboflavin synthase
MFTGIVTDVGRVRRVVPARGKGDARIEIATAYGLSRVPLGASIACAGCCLTVTAKGRGWFAAQASAETLSVTTLGRWRAGTRVNLERALKAGNELGGHYVSGHVDGVGTVFAVRPERGSLRLSVAVPLRIGRFVAPKGSVAVDGVSLTVNEVADAGGKTVFGVNIIPHTASLTTLGALKRGERVNVEIDMLARYGARLAEAAVRPGGGTKRK